jgi:hypothetical protein
MGLLWFSSEISPGTRARTGTELSPSNRLVSLFSFGFCGIMTYRMLSFEVA